MTAQHGVAAVDSQHRLTRMLTFQIIRQQTRSTAQIHPEPPGNALTAAPFSQLSGHGALEVGGTVVTISGSTEALHNPLAPGVRHGLPAQRTTRSSTAGVTTA